ncbi:APC family permease [Paractinoplanes durhamensis]|uniref:Transporter n=1 Tax=Paractinoplanes durhamensis TaxID=113563 RepID=A0ABQ3ZA59_9ACTN|nr:amino acid permease [Actinoplanes durhamensis]GIE06691.1 putative transporter [Actinoplanes durhamensis]
MTELRRRLDTRDAVVVGLGAMLGAGVFASFGPAARAAGGWLPLSLALAAAVAYGNAMSSARLAARYPASGGTYVYGRERLGPFWGYLAGWMFVVGKTASCAAMALTFAAYAAPGFARPAAVAAVLALTALNLFGVQRSVQATRLIVAVVLVVLAAVVTTAFAGAPSPGLGGALHPLGVLQGAGLLFFAFAGYARIATLGEEVRDPARTIPRAVTISLAVTLIVYTLVAFALLAALGPERLAASVSPLAEATPGWLAPAVRVGAAVAALGALLALILGVSRTGLAMARDGFLPRALAVVDARSAVPRRAELAVGLVVAALVATVDLRGAIGFSSFGVLLYYAIANAAWLSLAAGPARRAGAVAGLAGCLLLAFTLPWRSIGVGLAVAAAGALWYFYVARRARRP